MLGKCSAILCRAWGAIIVITDKRLETSFQLLINIHLSNLAFRANETYPAPGLRLFPELSRMQTRQVAETSHIYKHTLSKSNM